MNIQPPKNKADHRPRVAQMRRKRMRSHILSVVRENYPGLNGSPASLDEIIRTAEISKATFYKYFSSLEDAVSQHGAELAYQMILDMNAVYTPLSRPIDRVAMGCQLFLYRGINDRSWAAFISHIEDLPQDNLMLRYITADLEEGKSVRQFKIAAIRSTAWFVIGLTFAALKQISLGNGSRAFVHETVIFMLRGLGATEARINRALNKTETALFERGPAVFPWWKTDQITAA